jgi:peptide/nickel transport system substrate-binding protein
MGTMSITNSKIGSVITAALVVAACTPSTLPPATAAPSPAEAPRSGGTLVYGTAASFTPSSLDMVRSTLVQDQATGLNLYETLYRLNPDGDVEDWLAEQTVISSDGLTWTITLRGGVKFHDGTDFDAAAVKDNLEQRQALDTFLLRAQIQPIEEVRVIDSGTVQLLLSRPFDSLRKILASPSFGMQSPTAMAEFSEPDEYARNAAGTAPFKVESFSTEEIILVRFDEYWGPKAHLDRLVFRFVPEPAARILAVEAGDIQVAEVSAGPELERLRSEAEVSLITPEPQLATWMVFNTGRGPTAEKLVRQAIVYAINKDAIPPLYFGLGKPADSLVAPTIVGYTNETTYPHDPEEARRLLAEAGIQPGTPLDLVPGSGGVQTIEAAQLIKEDLDSVGFNVTIRTVEFSAWLAEVRKSAADSQWNITIFLAGATQTLDAEEPYRRFLYGPNEAPDGNNWSHYNNPEFDTLLDQQTTVNVVDERNLLLADLHHILWDDVPVYPLAWTGEVFLTTQAVRDVEVVFGGRLQYYRAWLAQ